MVSDTLDTAIHEPSALREVRRLLAEVEADRRAVESAGACGDPALVAEVSLALAFEARLLDARRLEPWLDLWEPDAVLWVPLPPDYSANDQSLLLDDRRRLGERIRWHRDPAAWGVQPAPATVRAISGVEVWAAPDTSGDEVLVASVLHVLQASRERSWSTTGRQIHRLRHRGGGWRLVRKTLLLPELITGVPNLGWLL